MEDFLRKNLEEALGLPKDAVSWLVDIWVVIQFFDDIADCEPTSREDLNTVLWNLLVQLPLNPFYNANQLNLSAALATAILKWQGSDAQERNGKADAKSYMWRASYYDLVLTAVLLCHGPKVATEAAPRVMQLYGETFEDYMKEFDHA